MDTSEETSHWLITLTKGQEKLRVHLTAAERIKHNKGLAFLEEMHITVNETLTDDVYFYLTIYASEPASDHCEHIFKSEI